LISKSRMGWGLVAVLACASMLMAGDKKEKSKTPSSQLVDSGSFGVFVRGQRVVTEKFDVHQENGISIVKSHLEEVGGAGGASQKSELEMTSSGELIRYDWTNGTSSLVVTPSNEFLLEKMMTSPSAKPAERPFLMPSTSAIMDNNFFIHRQVLAWRYLATNCQNEAAGLKCQQGPLEFGALVPQDQTSLRVRIELAGRDKVTIRGVERELLRLNLIGEEFNWALWVDEADHFKLIRVLIPDANTEVIRD
jgi:hypothetical protein